MSITPDNYNDEDLDAAKVSKDGVTVTVWANDDFFELVAWDNEGGEISYSDSIFEFDNIEDAKKQCESFLEEVLEELKDYNSPNLD